MKSWKIFSLLALPLLAGMTSSCSKDEADSVEEGDYSYLQAGLITETQSDGTAMYFIPVEGNSSQMAVTWERSNLTYARLCQMLGGSAGEKYDATNQKGITTYVGDVTIPATTKSGEPVTAIGKWAFVGNIYLKKLTLPESITTIEDEAATYCDSLAEMNIPAGVTYIGNGALAYNDLTDITVPAGVETIHRFSFAFTSSLKNLTFAEGSKLTTIEACAFTQFTDKGCAVTSLTLPNTVTSIGNKAFSYFTKLTAIDLSNTQVTSLGDYAFQACKVATVIKLPNSLETLGQYCFTSCAALKTADFSNTQLKALPDYCFKSITTSSKIKPVITLPATCQKIGLEALPESQYLTLHLKSTTPPSHADGASLKNMKIYIPSGSLAAYQADEFWNQYTLTEE